MIKCLLKSLVLLFLWSCARGTEGVHIIRQEKKVQYPELDSTLNLGGQQLANIYCQQCHLLPDPGLLRKEVWERGVLPRMGHYLGMQKTARGPYENLSMMEEHLLRKAKVFPDEPKISPSDWQKIQEYYYERASIDSNAVDFPLKISPLFHANEQKWNSEIPYVTMLDYDEKDQKLYVGDRRNRLWLGNMSTEEVQEIKTEGPPVSKITDKADKTYILSMGIMDPSNQNAGILYREYEDSLQAILGQLRRPVHMLAHDLNDDGEEDLVISEFGNDIGELSVVLFKKERPYKKQTLIPEAGARKSIAYDWNQDGKEDLLVLMTQGDERIVLLEKEGAGEYIEKTLLRFPSVYGSSDIELADMNGDGLKDILYVNGDNADYSYSLKPYHGIRIYLNRGKENPEEAFFFPMHGATDAVVGDFDQDGDPDIAGIAYFANFEGQPASGAVYLENNSQEDTLVFDAWQLPNASHGRWLTIEKGDINQDGDEDVLLGSCVVVRTPVPDTLKTYWSQKGADLMILENQLK